VRNSISEKAREFKEAIFDSLPLPVEKGIFARKTDVELHTNFIIMSKPPTALCVFFYIASCVEVRFQ
jgi:hypothetical protein